MISVINLKSFLFVVVIFKFWVIQSEIITLFWLLRLEKYIIDICIPIVFYVADVNDGRIFNSSVHVHT